PVTLPPTDPSGPRWPTIPPAPTVPTAPVAPVVPTEAYTAAPVTLAPRIVQTGRLSALSVLLGLAFVVAIGGVAFAVGRLTAPAATSGAGANGLGGLRGGGNGGTGTGGGTAA